MDAGLGRGGGLTIFALESSKTLEFWNSLGIFVFFGKFLEFLEFLSLFWIFLEFVDSSMVLQPEGRKPYVSLRKSMIFNENIEIT